MKIDFSQIELNKNKSAEPAVSGRQKSADTGTAMAGITADLGIYQPQNSAYSGKKRTKNTQKTENTLADKLDDLSSYNEKNQRNYMAVMSNTLSDKDYEELVKNGYAPGQMEIKDAVTSLDRMKVKLSEAGIEVKGYTDTVSAEKTEEITGVKTALKTADLPETDENVKGMQEAIAMASNLTPMNDASVKYMIENDMEPTISNVYEAQFSAGSTIPADTQTTYFTADATGKCQGYLAQTADNKDLTANSTIMDQIDQVIKDAGLEVTDDTEKAAEWLIKSGIPLNKDTLNLYEDIQSVNIKPDTGELTAAISDGKKPTDAYLIKNYKNIKSERQLKETALAQMSDANIKLAASDFSIDTSSLENEVESLKTKEKKAFDLLDETLVKVSDIKEQPAEILGAPELLTTSPHPEIKTTLNELHASGTAAAKKYEAAKDTYEAVGTEVRPDLGDNIQKAFRNTDDLLQQINMEPTDENRRAVRILGYNRMEVTADNVDRVKTADTTVNKVLDELTPKNVMKLIRENINPLETGIDTLSDKLDEYKAADEKDSVKFSDYLVKMQNTGEITEDEATSYIGIYRLVDKIVKSDGAAVGALVNQNAEVNMKNLLSAVRTKKKGYVDVTVNNDFAGIEMNDDEVSAKIDTEIKTAFSKDSYEGGTQKFADAAKAEEYVYRMLQNADVSVTADNVNAAAMLMSSRGSFIKGLYNNSSDQSKDRLKKAADEFIDSMEDSDSAREAYDELTDVENLASLDGEKLDLRLMQSYHKVISLQQTLADSENYEVPVEINGEITSINLQIKHGEIGGKVDITCESDTLGKISASLFMTGETTEGTVACSGRTGETYVNERIDQIISALSQDGREVKIGVVRSGGLNINRPVDAMDGEDTIETAALYRTARAFIGGIFHEDQQQYNGISDK